MILVIVLCSLLDYNTKLLNVRHINLWFRKFLWQYNAYLFKYFSKKIILPFILIDIRCTKKNERGNDHKSGFSLL